MILHPDKNPRQGAAMIAVLLALALLLSLGVPFLFASRLRSDTANRVFDRARARIAVDSASDSNTFHQALSHPAFDPTPLWDSPDEWDLTRLAPMPQALGDEWATAPESWGAEVENLQARVSLATAPSLLLQNLIHPCISLQEMTYGDTELRVNSTEGFPDSGLFFLAGRWVYYGGKTEKMFTDVQPAANPPDDLDITRFVAGTTVVDARTIEASYGRISVEGWRPPGSQGRVLDFDLGSGGLAAQDRLFLEQRTWPSTGGFGSDEWLPPTYQLGEIDPENPNYIGLGSTFYYPTGSFVRIVPEDRPPIDAMVVAGGSSGLLLSVELPLDLEPYHTRVFGMRREPVDVNACRFEILEALVFGLAFRNIPIQTDQLITTDSPDPQHVSPREARAVAERIFAERPLTGPDDLWVRVLQPLIEEDKIKDVDGWAILLNSIEPTSGYLRQSTTGFAYRSGNRYLTRTNAAVRSRLGRTLARASFREDVHVAPDGPLLDLIQDQHRMDDMFRHGRGLHGMVTQPNNLGLTTRAFGQIVGAISMRAGTMSETGRVVPSVEEDLSVISAVPMRSSDTFPANGIGRVEHFDTEVSPLGRKVDERGPFTGRMDDWNVPVSQFGTSDIEPLYAEGWFYFDGGVTDCTLIDIAGVELARNRVSAAIENGILIVRCWDTAGEDPADPDGLEEAVTVRIDPLDVPMDNRWVHLAVLLRGSSARGVQVYLDGVPRGDIDGFTYLAAATQGYSPGDTGGSIAVESTEGFADQGAIRIGNEVIEYSGKTETSFILSQVQADGGWRGGRAAREATDSLAVTLDTVHPEGAGVEQYGYSAILADDIMPGGASLTGEFGPWSLGSVIEGTDDIEIMTQLGFTFPAGTGLSGNYTGPIELAPLPQAEEDELYAEAFQSDGGFALLWTGRLAATNSDDGSRIGGIEIVRYSARQGTTLTLSERNVQTPGVADWPDGIFAPEGTTFVTEWNPDILIGAQGTPIVELEAFKVYIMPISVKGSGVSDLSYRDGDENQSQFVQITSEDDSFTEWVRYDHIYDSHFLRDDWGALSDAFDQLFNPNDEEDPLEQPQGQGPGGGGRPMISQSSGFEPEPDSTVRNGQEPEDDFLLRPTIGLPEERSDYIEEIAQRFDFRGAMGTFDHPQAAGTPLVPVFQTVRGFDANRGLPGRLDRVAAMQPGDSSPPFWFTIQWADTRPGYSRVNQSVWYVAFDNHPGLPVPASDFQALQQSGENTDLRNFARITKFPNQERPQYLDSVTFGGDVANLQPTMPGIIDEVSVHAPGSMGGSQQYWSRGAFFLMFDVEENLDEDDVIEVNATSVLVDGVRRQVATNVGQYLSNLPATGIIDIDGERIAYKEVRPAEGEFVIGPNGRGLHGTERRAHASGAKVWIVDGRANTVLSDSIGAGDWVIPLADRTGFKSTDLLLIDEELLHAPMGLRPPFAMPRERPVSYEGQPGAGILRARFGTDAAAHPDDTLVYSFPSRFMHTYAPMDDSFTLARAQFGWEEPGAFWRGIRWEEEHADGTAQARVLVRVGDAPWDGDPDRTIGLSLLEEGARGGQGFVPLNLRDDRLQVRFMFDWQAGSFDPVTFNSFGYLSSPRIRRLMLDYVAETRTYQRQEITE